jgi:drug/metabolite transporter (DMT)-like permease
VATAVLAWIFYGQGVTPAFAVGAVLVICGVMLTQF